MRFIDLSHTVRDGTLTYPGLPRFKVTDYLSRADSVVHYGGDASFHIASIEMVTNTGTYVDVPFHRFDKGYDLSDLNLHRVANVPGIVLNCRGLKSIDATVLTHVEVAGKAVLLWTGASENFGSATYPQAGGFLTESGAELLASLGAACVGIDACNIDNMQDKRRPAHTVLLNDGIPIIEHLCNLADLEGLDFSFFAIPPKISAVGSFPVRAFAMTASGQPAQLSTGTEAQSQSPTA